MKFLIKIVMVFLVFPLFVSGEIADGDGVPQLVFHNSDGSLVFLNDYVGEPRMLNSTAERVPVLLVFFRTDEGQVGKWLPKLAEELKKKRNTVIFVAVDESSKDVEDLRKSLGVRAFFVVDKYGSGAEEVGLTPVSRFSRAPSALAIRADGTVEQIFKDFRYQDIESIVRASEKIREE